MWLGDWRRGDERARAQLFAVVHPHLRRLATRLLRAERLDHTLEPDALVNELCIRLFGHEPLEYRDRVHFFAIAAQTMRRILIDHARARVRVKRGGRQRRLSLSAVEGWNPVADHEDVIALDEALSSL